MPQSSGRMPYPQELQIEYHSTVSFLIHYPLVCVCLGVWSVRVRVHVCVRVRVN